MGAYVSTANCAAHYGTPPNCTVIRSDDGLTAIALGDSTPGRFSGDPDIAGIGVLGAFLTTTVFSLLLSVANMFWWSIKYVLKPHLRITREEKALKNWQISIAGILETLCLTLSDQQVFTGGAYAITLRYAKACSISAYHYNVVANILLVTCATHLMAVTVSKHYWKHPYVGILRIIVTTLVYVITGVLLSNQGDGSLGFPTQVPPMTDQYNLMLLPAACFQSGEFLFGSEIKNALEAGSFQAFFTGQIHGWTNFLIMFLFFIIAVLVSLGRVIRRGTGHNGRRKRFIARVGKTLPFLFKAKRFFYFLFGLYLLAGIGISAWTVIDSALYVFELRRWVDHSVWLERVRNINPENDPSTFGQLVPLLLMSLTVFTFLTILSERIHARRKRASRLEYLASKRKPRSPGASSTAVQASDSHDNDGKSKTLIGVAISEWPDGTPTPPSSNIMYTIPLDSHSSSSTCTGTAAGSSAPAHSVKSGGQRASASAFRSTGTLTKPQHPHTQPQTPSASGRTPPLPSYIPTNEYTNRSVDGTPYLAPLGSFSSPLLPELRILGLQDYNSHDDVLPKTNSEVSLHDRGAQGLGLEGYTHRDAGGEVASPPPVPNKDKTVDGQGRAFQLGTPKASSSSLNLERRRHNGGSPGEEGPAFGIKGKNKTF
ncbi:hypothetical protein N656DRAFT_462551 [Canariomyces notabilis]|uniref:Uncharacterized protein n=1 Tax=Canariomyces notabilis TaxID=2074819 RepID=A0AAN6QCY6_9PEZI|nr:hypothetical protein N656DRAFT_462551 [Canariomyces arenarius]